MKVTVTFSMDKYNFWIEQSNKADMITFSEEVFKCLIMLCQKYL